MRRDQIKCSACSAINAYIIKIELTISDSLAQIDNFPLFSLWLELKVSHYQIAPKDIYIIHRFLVAF